MTIPRAKIAIESNSDDRNEATPLEFVSPEEDGVILADGLLLIRARNRELNSRTLPLRQARCRRRHLRPTSILHETRQAVTRLALPAPNSLLLAELVIRLAGV